MAKFDDNRFASVSNTWETPDDLFNVLNEEFAFTLDVAASSENTKCSRFFSAQQDGLTQDWGTNTCWLNPPYGDGKSRLADWVEKAYAASCIGATVVMLIPARTNTTWFHEFCTKGEIRFVKGRPIFKGAKHGLPQPLLYVIFRPNCGNSYVPLNKRGLCSVCGEPTILRAVVHPSCVLMREAV